MGREDYDGPDECVDDLEETEDTLQVEMEIPDVWWKDRIAEIENPVLQEKAIEKAEKLLEKEKELDRKLESGEIDEIGHWGERLCDLKPKETAAAVEADLFSVDLTWDKLADLAEDNALLQQGDIGTVDLKERNKELIREVGVEKSQEIADRMREEGRLTKEGYETVSRLIRNQKEECE